jgi:hypothetical protein
MGKGLAGTWIALLVLGACAADPPPARPLIHPGDVDAWKGAPIIELERHPFFSTVPPVVQKLSDGSELRTHKNCVSSREDIECQGVRFGALTQTTCSGEITDACCSHQFFVRGGVVEEYRPVGRCHTSCSRRPASRPCTADER